jgi:hypothetical protein
MPTSDLGYPGEASKAITVLMPVVLPRISSGCLFRQVRSDTVTGHLRSGGRMAYLHRQRAALACLHCWSGGCRCATRVKKLLRPYSGANDQASIL